MLREGAVFVPRLARAGSVVVVFGCAGGCWGVVFGVVVVGVRLRICRWLAAAEWGSGWVRGRFVWVCVRRV